MQIVYIGYVHMSVVPKEARRGCQILLELEVGGCMPPNMGAGNKTWVLWKSGMKTS